MTTNTLRYDVTTALTLIFPNIPFINETRSKHDKAYKRWMPHINFLFPFVEEEHIADMKTRLTKALSGVKPFQVDLNNLNYFPQGKKKVTFHLKPTSQSELNNIYTIVRSTLPEVYVKHPEFRAHLTLGQCSKQDFQSLNQELQVKMKTADLTFDVDALYIIQRSKTDKEEPFQIVHKIEFGSNT
jgi:RNA 2',3'-cyclic 3'-phosphodiesterase